MQVPGGGDPSQQGCDVSRGVTAGCRTGPKGHSNSKARSWRGAGLSTAPLLFNAILLGMKFKPGALCEIGSDHAVVARAVVHTGPFSTQLPALASGLRRGRA